jgi:hypothetical protein
MLGPKNQDAYYVWDEPVMEDAAALSLSHAIQRTLGNA